MNKDKKSIFEKFIYNDNFKYNFTKYNFTEWNFINYHFINFWEYDNDLNQINFLKWKNNIEKILEIEKNMITIF